MMHKNIRDTKEALLNKKLSVTELTLAQFQEIQKKNQELNAFITLDEEGALETAKRLDKIDKKSAAQMPLFGIPIGHKDIFLTQNLRTTAASRALGNYIPAYSATVVERLAAAGSVTLGKLNCDAWAHGSSGENSDFGPTKNPHNTEYVAGGSSSGSAAAVAAGLVLGATATDTGGSIRLPANFTGTVGFKPTYGRVSRYGVIAMASSLDSMGHVTANVEDAAYIFAVTSGSDIKDATSANSRPFEVPDFSHSSLKGKKIGIPSEYVSALTDKEVATNLETVKQQLSKMGAEILEISLPHTEYGAAVYYIIQPAEVSSNLARYDGIRFGFGRDKFSPEAIRRMMIGTYTLSAGYYDAFYKTAQKVRTLIKRDFDQAFSKVDLILAPVSPTPAFKLGERTSDPLSMYLSDALAIPVNLAGLPAIALPTGRTVLGLPLGVQLIADHYQEKKLFPAAYTLEQNL